MDQDILKALREILKEELQPITETIEEHTTILKKHTTVLEEHTQILRALEHSAQVYKAEQDKISNDIAHIKGNIESLRKDVSTVEVVTSSNYADIAKLKAIK